MGQLSMDCPHCRTVNVGFAPRGACPVKQGTNQMLVLLQCQVCGQGVIGVIKAMQQSVLQWMADQISSAGVLLTSYPGPSAPKAPAYIPDNVRSAFLSGLENLGRTGGANAAAIMFRRSIEIAVKKINPDASKRDDLKKRINDLAPEVATPSMKEWAHAVRLDANDAAHEEEEFSKEDAEKLHLFAEMFLTYAFTLPATLERAKNPPPTAK